MTKNCHLCPGASWRLSRPFSTKEVGPGDPGAAGPPSHPLQEVAQAPLAQASLAQPGAAPAASLILPGVADFRPGWHRLSSSPILGTNTISLFALRAILWIWSHMVAVSSGHRLISKVYLASCGQLYLLIDWDPAAPPPLPHAFGLIYEGAIGQPRWTTSFCNPLLPGYCSTFDFGLQRHTSVAGLRISVHHIPFLLGSIVSTCYILKW